MKRFKCILLALVLLFPAISLAARDAKTPAVLLQEARYAEEIDGNLDKAISLYGQIIKDTSAEGAVKAQAMYQQGLCFMKKQDDAKAQAVLGNLIEQFPKQTKLVERARVVLLELTDSDPATLMPPETLVYVELGSPGKQIETILNMLKGTPFENPLAAIGQGSQPAGQQSPAQIFNALLNPSMMTELKKIRGLAVGVTEMKNNPSLVAVLYPGKSDAFRGLVMAGLGMAGQPAEPIEDMNVLNIQNTAGVAYDDTVIIVAQPMDLFKKTISLYKRKSSGPNLAENNKAFAEIGKKSRRENALTIWANVDQVYEAFKKVNSSEQLKLAETFVDPQNIDELLATLSINNNAINFDAKVNFKPGHQGLAYDFFRTPNLTTEGFAFVPSDSAAVVSFSLSPVTGEKIQKPLESITGLDIGREIFDNIEQINVFVVPTAFAKNNAQDPVALTQCLGIAITSRNPVQTQQILKTILGTANTIAGLSSGQPNAAQPNSNQYLLPLGRNEKLYCYLGQDGKNTILTFSPELLKLSLSAQGKSNSILMSGPLQAPIRQLSPNTSKMALLNVGGLVKVAESWLKVKNENSDNPAYQKLDQIAALFEKTNIQIRTNEKADGLAIHAGIEGIPPMGDVFPLVQQYAQSNPNAKTIATNPRPADRAAVPEGADIKLQWSSGAASVSHKVYFGSDPANLSLLTETKENNAALKPLEDVAGYYWRVDEVWADGTIKTGTTWRFYTGGLIAHWKLDETEGSVAKDSSKHKFDAVVKGGAQWQSDGQVAGALSFDGVDDYIELPEAVNQFGGGFSVVLWAKPAGNETWARFFEFGNGEQKDNIILSRLNNSNNLMFEVFYGSEWPVRVIAQNAIDLNTWQCFAVTVDREGNASLYKNGKRIQKGKTSEIQDIVRKQLYIGKSQWPTDQMYKGLIDDFRLYNYVLSEREIAQIYQSTPNIKVEESVKTEAVSRPSGGLVGWWKLDETGGSIAVDSSGGNPAGVLLGNPQWQPAGGKVGGALEFNGVDDYVDTGYKTDLPAWTVAVWVKSPAGPSTEIQSGPVHREKNYHINWSHVFDAFRGAAAVSVNGTWYAASFGELQANTWYHLAATYDGENLKAYKDGVLITDNPEPSGSPDPETETLKLGKHAMDIHHFAGTIDDVRIYSYALSDSEIADIYKGSPGTKVKETAATTDVTKPYAKGLVGWWKLDGNADDSSGKGNNGTVMNGPQWIAGRINGGLRFDGVDDCVSLPIGQLISTLNSSTLAVWVDFSNAGGVWQRIFDFGADTSNYIYLSPRTDANGPMRVAITAGEGQWTDLDASTGTLPSGWHHVAVVLEPGNLRLYLDGIIADSTNSLYVLSNLGVTSNNWLGRSQYPTDAYFNGALDEFRIYNFALSDNEIAGLYKSAFNSETRAAE